MRYLARVDHKRTSFACVTCLLVLGACMHWKGHIAVAQGPIGNAIQIGEVFAAFMHVNRV